MKNFYLIDLFSGAGALGLGFERAGFLPLMANEVDEDIAKTYAFNHKATTVITGDIKKIEKTFIEDLIYNKEYPIDYNTGIINIEGKPCHKKLSDDDYIIIGGPPCQSYSTAGKRQLDDRSQLFKEYVRILSIVHPLAFVFENVKGILSMDKGRLFKAVSEALETEGYTIYHKILNAVNYGVPQERERVIIIGIRNDIKDIAEKKNKIPLLFEDTSPTLKDKISFKDATIDLPSLLPGETKTTYTEEENEYTKEMRNGSMILTEHTAPNCSARMRKLMLALGDGEGKESLSDELKPKSGFGNTYAKMYWNKPSSTITRNFSCPSSARCIHPRDSRALTIREGARLQSFPDDYVLFGNKEKKRLMIGNAVPVKMAEAIGKNLMKFLNEVLEDI